VKVLQGWRWKNKQRAAKRASGSPLFRTFYDFFQQLLNTPHLSHIRNVLSKTAIYCVSSASVVKIQVISCLVDSFQQRAEKILYLRHTLTSFPRDMHYTMNVNIFGDTAFCAVQPLEPVQYLFMCGLS
jgi:hypothetical protein